MRGKLHYWDMHFWSGSLKWIDLTMLVPKYGIRCTNQNGKKWLDKTKYCTIKWCGRNLHVLLESFHNFLQGPCFLQCEFIPKTEVIIPITMLPTSRLNNSPSYIQATSIGVLNQQKNASSWARLPCKRILFHFTSQNICSARQAGLNYLEILVF